MTMLTHRHAPAVHGVGGVDRPLVIVPCGKAKLAVPAPAEDLYIGQFVRACLGYARTLTAPDRILILSAKHGLVDLTTVLAPYNTRFPKGEVDAADVREQARRRGQLNETVVALGGRHYVSICRAVWPGCAVPMEGLGGLGYMLSWLKARTPAA